MVDRYDFNKSFVLLIEDTTKNDNYYGDMVIKMVQLLVALVFAL